MGVACYCYGRRFAIAKGWALSGVALLPVLILLTLLLFTGHAGPFSRIIRSTIPGLLQATRYSAFC